MNKPNIIKLKEQKSNLMQDDKKYLHIIPRLQEGIDSLEKIAITSTFKSKNQNWQKLNEEVITPFKNIEKKSHKERNLFANFFKKMNILSKSTPQTRFHTIVIREWRKRYVKLSRISYSSFNIILCVKMYGKKLRRGFFL